MQKNVTSAIRAAVKSYVQYGNRSDPHFPNTSGRLDDGRAFAVSDPFVDGLDRALQKVTVVWIDPNTDGVMVAAEHTLHNLSGTFNLRMVSGMAEQQEPSHTIDFAVDRVSLNIEFDALRPNCLCSAIAQVNTISTRSRHDRRDDTGKLPQVANAFVNAFEDHLSVGTCKAIAKSNKYGTNPCLTS